MPDGQISPWMPEQDRIRIAVLGKLAEECNELAARAARCIIHGLHEVDPDSGRYNIDELEREMADVFACLSVARMRLRAEPDINRIETKMQGFARWHRMIEDR
ncbi:hypothetical protein [Pelagibacterium limicola]|uniref:hypothetical protein n=1 Tax=Pelagibacterium limicola TaxID=2791022 RepID=UPI001A9C2731|nr:hypothetical protein [Pelagibacterium limicola]